MAIMIAEPLNDVECDWFRPAIKNLLRNLARAVVVTADQVAH
jgi:hypothetical protein